MLSKKELTNLAKEIKRLEKSAVSTIFYGVVEQIDENLLKVHGTFKTKEEAEAELKTRKVFEKEHPIFIVSREEVLK